MQAGGAKELEKQVCSRLEDARLTFGKPERFATPRRLALLVRDLPAEQPDITVERKGPRVDAPEKAIAGFLRSTGLTLEDCEQRETPKGPVWFAVKQEKGRPTGDLLADLCPRHWPQSPGPSPCAGTRAACAGCARFAPSSACWTMQVVPFRFGTVESGRTTLGHRFLCPGPLTIAAAGRLRGRLSKTAKVMLDRERRGGRSKIAAQVLARRAGYLRAPDAWLGGRERRPRGMAGGADGQH